MFRADLGRMIQPLLDMSQDVTRYSVVHQVYEVSVYATFDPLPLPRAQFLAAITRHTLPRSPCQPNFGLFSYACWLYIFEIGSSSLVRLYAANMHAHQF